MKTKFNPSFTLTPEQAEDLSTLWTPISSLVDPSKDTLVKVKLSRKNPVFTRRQIYMIIATAVNLGFNKVPDWMHQILDPE
jgi:hypothetical protein